MTLQPHSLPGHPPVKGEALLLVSGKGVGIKDFQGNGRGEVVIPHNPKLLSQSILWPPIGRFAPSDSGQNI